MMPDALILKLSNPIASNCDRCYHKFGIHERVFPNPKMFPKDNEPVHVCRLCFAILDQKCVDVHIRKNGIVDWVVD